MQIHVGLPSRGRPLDMVASAVSLFRLASGAHELCVTVAADIDDTGTAAVADELGISYPGLGCVSVERPAGSWRVA